MSKNYLFDIQLKLATLRKERLAGRYENPLPESTLSPSVFKGMIASACVFPVNLIISVIYCVLYPWPINVLCITVRFWFVPKHNPLPSAPFVKRVLLLLPKRLTIQVYAGHDIKHAVSNTILQNRYLLKFTDHSKH
jgi:hypothetical protein